MEEARKWTADQSKAITGHFAIEEDTVSRRKMTGEGCRLREERKNIFRSEEGEECGCLTENEEYENEGCRDSVNLPLLDECVECEEKREKE